MTQERITPPHSAAAANRNLQIILITLLATVAGVLRWRCALGEFWLDEVWTWDICQQLTWPGGLFYQLREENNHYLNTLWIWLLGRETWWGWYRLLPVLCGVGSVVLAWRLASARAVDHPEAENTRCLAGWMAAGLTAASYLMIHFSSEARGYAYAVLFAAWAFSVLPSLVDAQLRKLRAGEQTELLPDRSLLWFTLACCGGFLSQPVFLTCYGAMGIWVFLKLRRTTDSGQGMPFLWSTFFPSAVFFILLYAIDLRYAVNGGGDIYPLWQVVTETLSLTGGGPGVPGVPAFVVAGLVLGAFGNGLRVMSRRGDDRWVFHLLVVVVMPLLLLIALRRKEVYPRYFIISVFYLLQAAAIGLADLWSRGMVARVGVAAAILATLVGQGQHYQRLATRGRGDYRQILETMAQEESSPRIEIVVDQEFRHRLMFSYWQSRTDLKGKSLEIVPSPGPAPWVLTHRLDPNWKPDDTLTLKNGVRYRLRIYCPYAGLSGWGLALYHQIDEQTPAVAVRDRRTPKIDLGTN